MDVYLIAAMGTSPGVLTELAWHLVRIGGHRVVGVEIWTTSFARKIVRNRLVEHGWWDDLRRAIGPDALPPLHQGEDLGREVPCPDPGRSPSFRTYVFQHDGVPLEDVRGREDADAASEALYDRVRELRQQLPAHVQLIGSLAGGRKTMSASLQSAFSYQARPNDRLVHVLLHKTLEDQPYEVLSNYAFPRETTLGVPVEAQVEVYDVPYPRMQAQRGKLLTRPVFDHLFDRCSYRQSWRAIDLLLASPDVRAELRLHPHGHWTYTVRCGDDVAHSVPLTPRSGRFLALLISKGGSASMDDVPDDWLSLGETGDDAERNAGRVRRWKANLLQETVALQATPFSEFLPMGGRQPWTVPLASEVTLTCDEDITTGIHANHQTGILFPGH